MVFFLLMLCRLEYPEPDVLFNGKNLDGWVAEGVKEFQKDGRILPVWSVANGHLVCTGKGFGFLRYDRRAFSDLLFHLRVSHGAGLQQRGGHSHPPVRCGQVAHHAAFVLQL